MSNTDERSMEMLKRGNKGFTLIELITVMVILGVLAAYAVPKLFDFTGTAKTKTRDQFKVEVNSALRMYGLQQLATTGSKTYPNETTLVLGDLIDEASSELTYDAATVDTGAFVYTSGTDVYYMHYTTGTGTYSLGTWSLTDPSN